MLSRDIYTVPFLCSLLSALCSAQPNIITGRQTNATSADNYDYIVVGSGPGGGPLSARLAIAGFRVLLIEAGDDQGASTKYQVPALNTESSEYAPMSWNYYVNHFSDLERQKKDSKMTWKTPSGELFVGPNGATGTGPPPAGSDPLGILYPRAGTLGGCSAHNALVTIYPHKSDWRDMASLTGDKTWEPDNMRKYFKKLERNRYVPNGIIGHGFFGWLGTALTDVTLLTQDLQLLTFVLGAASAVGNGIVKTIEELAKVLISDINADTADRDSTEGLFQVPLAMDNFHRNGPREFIVETIEAKKADGSRKYHLDLMMNTLVTKVLLDNSSEPRAVGVEFLKGQSLYRADPRANNQDGGQKGTARARREVILSTGSFNTPQLLKLSGIGPVVELEEHGIPVVVDLPGVGANLQDRIETSIGGETASEFDLTKNCKWDREHPDPCLDQWKNSPINKGVYGTNGLPVAIVKKSSVADGNPDLVIAGAPFFFTGYFPGYSAAALSQKRRWVWLVLKAHTGNRAGTVKLRSTDPRDTPEINFNNFDPSDAAAAERDLQGLYEGMEFSRRIADHVLPLNGSFKEVWPGPNVTTEAEMKDFIMNEAWGHHACCTARIGAEGDNMAVLDSRFRVRGVKGLRVVDASVFPKIPGFYIATPIYMISEKAADVIIEDARR